MKKLLIFIGVIVLSYQSGYAETTLRIEICDSCSMQEPQPVPQLPAELRAEFENDVRAFYNNKVALIEASSDKRLSEEDRRQSSAEFRRIMEEYNLMELANESGYNDFGSSTIEDGNVVRTERWSEMTLGNRRTIQASYGDNPPTLDDILANDTILPYEKLMFISSMATRMIKRSAIKE